MSELKKRKNDTQSRGNKKITKTLKKVFFVFFIGAKFLAKKFKKKNE